MGRLSILKAEKHINDFVDMFADKINKIKADNMNGSRAVYERNLYGASIFLIRHIKRNLDKEYAKMINGYFSGILSGKGILEDYTRILGQYYKKSDGGINTLKEMMHIKPAEIEVPAPKGDKTEVLAIDPAERLEDASIMARIVKNGERVYL